MNDGFYTYLLCLKRLGYQPYLDIKKLLFCRMGAVWNGSLRLNYKSKALRRFGFSEPCTITIPPYSLKCIWDRSSPARPDKCFPNGKLYLILDKQITKRILIFEESFRQQGIMVESCIFELPLKGLQEPLQILALGWKPGFLREKFFTWNDSWSCQDPLFSWKETNPMDQKNLILPGAVVNIHTILDFTGLCRVDTVRFWHYQASKKEECAREFEKLGGKAYDWKLTGEVKPDPLHPKDSTISDFMDKKSKIRAFFKAFPFGCIKSSSVKNCYDNIPYSFTKAWCYGRGFNTDLIQLSLEDLIDDDMFQVILKKPQLISVKYLPRVFNDFYLKKCLRFDRLEILRSIVASKYEKYDSDGEITLYPYTYLKGVSINKELTVSKPRWSPENHKFAAFEGFTATCLCLLAMQKFRWQEFPVSKDVLYIIMGKLFELGLQDFEAVLLLRQKHFIQLKKLYESGAAERTAVQKTCLKVGVLAFNWCWEFQTNIDQWLYYVVDSMLGNPISSKMQSEKRKIFNTTTYKTVYVTPHRHDDKYLISQQIVDYCRNHKLDLWMVLKDGERGKFKFRKSSADKGVELVV